MQQQQTKTSMSLGVKLFLASFIVMFITLIFLVIFAITVKFQAEKIENQLEASYQNMQNVYSSVEKILTSSGITVKNFGETKINAIKEYVKQHANNPELMMKWVQENPQQIDSKVWEDFQKQKGCKKGLLPQEHSIETEVYSEIHGLNCCLPV